MDVGQVKPARELITDWIMQEPNPRGRYNQYVGVAGATYELQKLLMRLRPADAGRPQAR